MQIQINLPEDISDFVKIYKVKMKLKTQKEAIINILKIAIKNKQYD